MSDIQNKTITVKSIAFEATPWGAQKTIITFDSNGKDYKVYFLDKKKDGGITKAQIDFDSIKPKIGTTLDVGVVAVPYDFISKKDGKNYKGNKYRIANMELSTGNGANVTRPMSRADVAPTQIAPIDEDEITVEDIPF